MAFKFQVGAARLSGSTTFEENLTAQGDLQGKTVSSQSTVSGSGALQGASVAVDGTVTGGTLVSNGTISGSTTISGGSVTTDGALTGGKLVIGSADITEAELEVLDSVTAGTVTASKVVVVDGNKDISEFRNLQAVQLSASTNIVLGTADLNETDLEQIDGITAGTAAASKALVLNSSSDISGINNVGAAQLSASGDVLLGGVLSGSSGAEIGGVVSFPAALTNNNAIVFHDGSGVLTDNSSLTFDGTDFANAAGQVSASAELRGGGLVVEGTVELNVDSTAGIDQAADSIFFRDSDGAVKRNTVIEFVNAIAGTGTQADNGQITVAGAGAFPLSDADHNLSGGINFFTGSLTAARTVTLPAASNDYAGIHFIVKGAANTSDTLTVTISPASGERIDGVVDNDVILESPGAAVTLVGVGTTGWAII
jgi:hypothetical protein